jgi:hypothetical protein
MPKTSQHADDETAPAKKPRITVVKNEYFTNFEINGTFHRHHEQIWNVSYAERALVIYLQAKNLRKLDFSIDETYFGRKHLMTFAGGKAAAADGDFIDKMKRVTAKRQTHVSTNLRKKIRDGRGLVDLPQNITRYAKYGIFGQNGKLANTLIFCDVLRAQELKEAFAKALIEGQNSEAFVRLPGSAVYTIADASSVPVKPVADDETVIVEIGFDKLADKEWYAVRHLGGCTQAMHS